MADTNNRSPLNFPPYPFALSGYFPTPVLPIYILVFFLSRRWPLASHSARQKITKIVTKVGGDQIQLVFP